MWWLCGQQACRGAGYIFFVSWFPSLLQEARHVSREDSGYLQSLVLGASAVGYLVGGFIADRVWERTRSLRLSRSGLTAAAHLVCGLLVLAAFYSGPLWLVVACLAGGAFFTAAGGTNALTVSIDIGGSCASQVYAVQNMWGNVASGLTPIVVGYIFKHTENWSVVLVLFAGIYIAGAIFWALVDPTKKLAPQTP